MGLQPHWRLSIPPERLLKAQLLIALYSVRSTALLRDARLQHSVSLVLDMARGSFFDASTFSKNRERLANEEVPEIL